MGRGFGGGGLAEGGGKKAEVKFISLYGSRHEERTSSDPIRRYSKSLDNTYFPAASLQLKIGNHILQMCSV